MTPWRPAEGRGQGRGASESEEGVDFVRPGHFYNLILDYKKGGGVRIAGIPLGVESAGLGPDWRFVACRSQVPV